MIDSRYIGLGHKEPSVQFSHSVMSNSLRPHESAPHQTAARHTHWPYFSLTWKFCWDHQWVSFTFTVRRWQEWGQALAWCFFFPCSFSSQRWRSTYNTNVFPRMYALGWAGQPTDRATFLGWFIFCGSQCVLGQGQFRWELDHKT